jgi:mRNA interferase HigB
MRIVSTGTLRRFAKANPQILGSIEAWIYVVKLCDWSTPNDLKRDFGSASVLQNGRVVFNIQGNKVRLVAAILFGAKALLVKFIGFHSEYDRIDAQTVDQTKWRQKDGN